jgi:hypothetical protein
MILTLKRRYRNANIEIQHYVYIKIFFSILQWWIQQIQILLFSEISDLPLNHRAAFAPLTLRRDPVL